MHLVCIYVCMMHVCLYVHLCMYAYMYACMRACMYVCLDGWMGRCVCVCVCVQPQYLIKLVLSVHLKAKVGGEFLAVLM